MVPVEQFPMFRLAALLARQLSSPVATRIKRYAQTHPRFSRVACASAARWYRHAELRFKLWSLRLGGTRSTFRPPPLSDAEAIEVGGDILGEAVIFMLGALIVMFEVNRQAEKQEAKVLDEESQWLAVQLSLEELQRELVLQQRDIDRLLTALVALQEGTALPSRADIPGASASESSSPARDRTPPRPPPTPPLPPSRPPLEDRARLKSSEYEDMRIIVGLCP